MDVFIGNLPGEATLASLDSFLGGLRLKADFECHRGRDRRDRSYHFLVAKTAAPEDGADLIARLDGKVFEGHALEAREYVKRVARHEWHGEERRINP